MKRRLALFPFPLLGILLAVVGTSQARAAEGRLDFSRDIRPILSDKCFACHGPDTQHRKGGLRLDQRESALAPAKSGARAIVPGKPEASELVARLETHDADDVMPPADSGKSITPAQKELLRRWIAGGAEYRDHWAFIPPERPPVPSPASGVRNPVDAFVRDRLEREGRKPAPEADPVTLVRRATLDLTGLPPTPEEVDAFLADRSPKAYEALVDRLLDSPRYGERMAVDWLDAARYADTHGYHLDSGRDMTAWRDWVIRAFNENKPFDQFTVEQLAGDLLPQATRDQKIASGFNRNHMINYEGGAIPEEYHYAYLVDRVNTTGTVWLGLALSCAQCHDHKYDPISKADYYRILAFFNQVPEKGLDGNKGNAAPVLKLPTPDQEARLAELNRQLTEAEALLANAPGLDEAQAAWEAAAARQGPVTWTPVVPVEATASGGARFETLDDRSLRVTGPNPATDVYTLQLPASSAPITALRIEALPDDALGERGPGRSGNGNFVLTTVRAERDGRELRWSRVSADFSQDGFPIEHVRDDRPGTGWAIHGAVGRPHAAVLQWEAPAEPGPITLILRFESQYSGHALGRFRVSVTDAADPHETQALPAELRAILARAPAERSDADRTALRKHFRDKVSPEAARLREAVAEARKRRDEFDARIPSTMVMAELDQPRDTYVRMRGQYDKLGEKVTAGTPAALPPLPPDAPANRLGLARWLVSPSHPLTARVIVNRYWQLYFGTGLVKTSEDFGSQGEWPSHPELLDWLAREFIESGWNVKHLQRLLVTSATYRQSSRVPTADYHLDPENRLLARGPRFRLQAEFVRDQALAISGLLNPLIGGASVSPYQPAGLWEELSMREDSKNFSAQFFVQSKGADLYRRSMYTFWKRSSPPPQMSTFDAPDRETCSVRRPRTNTPLQALVLLNDPTYVEASRKLAERLLHRPDSDADRIRRGFRLATARPPTPDEQAVLLRVLAEQRAHYRANPDAASRLLSVGESGRDAALEPAELAAWTMLSSTLLNLDETLTKG